MSYNDPLNKVDPMGLRSRDMSFRPTETLLGGHWCMVLPTPLCTGYTPGAEPLLNGVIQDEIRKQIPSECVDLEFINERVGLDKLAAFRLRCYVYLSKADTDIAYRMLRIYIENGTAPTPEWVGIGACALPPVHDRVTTLRRNDDFKRYFGVYDNCRSLIEDIQASEVGYVQAHVKRAHAASNCLRVRVHARIRVYLGNLSFDTKSPEYVEDKGLFWSNGGGSHCT